MPLPVQRRTRTAAAERPKPRSANRHDTKAIVSVLRDFADGGFRGKRLAEAGQALGIAVEAIALGRDGQFIPAGICGVVVE
jgi:hypothetical protein